MSEHSHDTNGSSGDIVEVALDDLLAQLAFEDAVPDGETAAAIASAVGAHLADQRRAAANPRERERETVDNWTFRNRLASVGTRPRHCPTNVVRGDEWRAAARSL